VVQSKKSGKQSKKTAGKGKRMNHWESTNKD
jgi:hypothetical protein